MGWSTFTPDGERKTSSEPGALGWEIIEVRNHTGGLNAIFNDFADYDQLNVIIEDVDIGTASAGMEIRTSTDGGATFSAGATDYISGGFWLEQGDATVTPLTGTGATTRFRLTTDNAGMAASSTRRGFWNVFLSDFSRANTRRASYTAFGKYPDFVTAELSHVSFSGHRNGLDSGPINAFTVKSTSGVYSGKITLLGLPKVVKIQDQIVLPPNGWQKIETVVATGAASVEFTDIDQFDGIELIAAEMTNSVDNTEFRLQVSVDGGSNWIVTNYRINSVAMLVNSASLLGNNSVNNPGFRLTNSVATGLWNAADANHHFHVRMTGIQVTATKDARITAQNCYSASSGSGLGALCNAIGVLPTVGAKINAVRFIAASGTISGKFTLFGLVQ